MQKGTKVKLSQEWFNRMPRTHMDPNRIGTVMGKSKDGKILHVQWENTNSRVSLATIFLQPIPEDNA